MSLIEAPNTGEYTTDEAKELARFLLVSEVFDPDPEEVVAPLCPADATRAQLVRQVWKVGNAVAGVIDPYMSSIENARRLGCLDDVIMAMRIRMYSIVFVEPFHEPDPLAGIRHLIGPDQVSTN